MSRTIREPLMSGTFDENILLLEVNDLFFPISLPITILSLN